jgi:hypothetical protein
MIDANAVSGAYQLSDQINLFRLDLGPILSRQEWIDGGRVKLGLFFNLNDIFAPAGAAIATRLEEAKTALHSIDEFASLEENWDGYGASPISSQVRGHAQRFIKMIEASSSGLPVPEVSPMPSGTISFEWETQNTEAYLEIGNTRYSGFIKTNRQQTVFLQGLAEDLDQQTVSLIQRAISAPAKPTAPITEIYTQQARQNEPVAA